MVIVLNGVWRDKISSKRTQEGLAWERKMRLGVSVCRSGMVCVGHEVTILF